MKEFTKRQILEQEISELDFTVHHEKDGDIEMGEGDPPSPYQMAEIAVGQIQLHPEYYRNEDLFLQFVDTIREVFMAKFDYGELKPTDGAPPEIGPNQMNESLDLLKKKFKKLV